MWLIKMYEQWSRRKHDCKDSLAASPELAIVVDLLSGFLVELTLQKSLDFGFNRLFVQRSMRQCITIL